MSLGEYYTKIGNKKFMRRLAKRKKYHKYQSVEDTLSEHTLKTVDIRKLKANLLVCIPLLKRVIGFYGSRNMSRQKFKRYKLRQQFMSTIVNRIAPEPETVVALGNAKFAVSRPGLSACPIAKVVQELVRETCCYCTRTIYNQTMQSLQNNSCRHNPRKKKGLENEPYR